MVGERTFGVVCRGRVLLVGGLADTPVSVGPFLFAEDDASKPDAPRLPEHSVTTGANVAPSLESQGAPSLSLFSGHIWTFRRSEGTGS